MDWSDILPQETLELGEFLADHAKRERENGADIYPPQELIFRALDLTPPDKVKVCIVGQDPYHTPGQANGLAFSVSYGHAIQPSLKNIFFELRDDLGVPIPYSGDLTRWACHGALLLNTSLTVYKGKANSCQSWGWSKFTSAVLRALTHLPQPIVFLLWGVDAQDMLGDLLSTAFVYESNAVVRENLIKKAYILSSHPSPLGAKRPCKGAPAFTGSRPFSNANRLLMEMGGEPMDWSL